MALTKQVVVRMEPEEYEKVEAMWKRAGFKSLQKAGMHALTTAFLQGPEVTVPVKYRPYLAKLEEILASGDVEIIRAATTNLDLWHDRLRPVGGGKTGRRSGS